MSWQQSLEAGNLAFAGGLYEAALPKYLQAVQLARKTHDLSGIGESTRALARVYLQLGKAEEAEIAATEAFDTDQIFWGYDNQQLADDMFWLGEARRRLGKFESARESMERAFATRVGLYGEIHDDSLSSMIGLIWLNLAHENRYDDVVTLMHRATTAFASLHPYGDFAKALNMQFLLRPYIEHNSEQEAEGISRRVQQALRTVLGDSNQEIQQVLKDCSSVMHDANKHMSAWRFKSRAAAMGNQSIPDRLANQVENMAAETAKEPDKHTVVPDFEKTPHPSLNFSEQPEGTELNPGYRQHYIAVDETSASEEVSTELPGVVSSSALPSGSGTGVGTTSEAPTVNYGSSQASIEAREQKFEYDDQQNYLGRMLRLASLDLDVRGAINWWLVCALISGAVSSIIYTLSGFALLAPWSFLFAVVTAFIGCGLWLSFLVSRHQSKLERQLPPALDQMASMLEAGSPVAECITSLGDNSPSPIRLEFSRCASMLRDGSPLKPSLTELTHHFSAQEVKSLVDAINISRSVGGGLARDVRLIARDLRDRESTAGGASLTSAQVKLWILILGIGFAVSTLQILFIPGAGVGYFQSTAVRAILVLFFLTTAGSAAVLATPEQSGPALRRLKSKLLSNYSRQQVGIRLRSELPSFLDKIVILTEIGISLPQAVAQVRNESSASCPTLCRELEYTIDHLTSFKSAIPSAFRKMGEEYKVQELIELGSALDAAERSKSSIGYQLREQSGALRSHLTLSRRARKTKTIYVVFVIVACIVCYLMLFGR
jgi:Flp pilus assembly protein TadB